MDGSYNRSSLYNPAYQYAPRHFVHGVSPLRKCVCSAQSEDEFTDLTECEIPAPPKTLHSWPGAQRVYEGPPPAKHFRYRAPPPHLSLWQADSRERTAFELGLLPPYVEHLAMPPLSPLETSMTSWAMEIDEAHHDYSRNDESHPNWYRTPTSPKLRRAKLPPQMTGSEAGLRLRLMRIASACSLYPQLADRMQALLHKEIRAAMYREELALLAHIQNRPRSNSEGTIGRPQKRKLDPADSNRWVQKKMRIAETWSSRPQPFVPKALREIVTSQTARDPPYASDFMNEDEIMERSWMESMTRRTPSPNLRKSLLLQRFADNAVRVDQRHACPMPLTDFISVIHTRNWRVHCSVWNKESETIIFNSRREHSIRFPTSFHRYHGQLPTSSSSPKARSMPLAPLVAWPPPH